MKPKCIEIKKFKLLNDYNIEFTFDDGKQGVLNLKKFVGGKGVFKALENPEIFRLIKLDPELGTISWPNGADIAPDTLYSSLFD